MANQRLVEGDERQKQHGCLHFLDLAERGAGFKMRLAIEASANLQCRQRSKQGGDVEQRHRRPDTVILIEFPAVPPKITGFAHYRSEEHTSELQSLMRITYAVFCLKK